jgi:hypothetical protein
LYSFVYIVFTIYPQKVVVGQQFIILYQDNPKTE